MATTATPVTAPQNPDTTGRQTLVDFTVVLTGNYGSGASNGDTLDLTPLMAQSSQLPTWVEIGEYPVAGTAPTGYQFGYAPGTTIANGKLTIMGAAGTPAGTISAPVFTGESYTPAGTNSAPTITTSSGGVTTALGVAAGALSEVSGASGITGVQAPTFTGTAHTLAGTNSAPTFTGTAPASGSSQYPEGSAYSAGLLAAVIRGRAWFPAY